MLLKNVYSPPSFPFYNRRTCLHKVDKYRFAYSIKDFSIMPSTAKAYIGDHHHHAGTAAAINNSPGGLLNVVTVMTFPWGDAAMVNRRVYFSDMKWKSRIHFYFP